MRTGDSNVIRRDVCVFSLVGGSRYCTPEHTFCACVNVPLGENRFLKNLDDSYFKIKTFALKCFKSVAADHTSKTAVVFVITLQVHT